MRTLITATAWFTASTVIDRLLADCHRAVRIDNLGTGVAG